MKTSTKKSGFTLIEIMVAVSIFAIVAVIATGALITASDINRKAQAIKLAVDNVNFAISKIMFELKLGGIYRCSITADPSPDSVSPGLNEEGSGLNCENNGNAIHFYSRRDDCDEVMGDITYCGLVDNKVPISYKFLDNTDPDNPNSIVYNIGEHNPSSFIAVTSPEVKINSLEFVVRGAETPGDVPRVIVKVQAVVGEGTKYATPFNITAEAITRGN